MSKLLTQRSFPPFRGWGQWTGAVDGGRRWNENRWTNKYRML